MSPPYASEYVGVPHDDESLSGSLPEKGSYHSSSHHPVRTRRYYAWWSFLALVLWTASIFIAVKLFSVTTVVLQTTDVGMPEERIGCGTSSAEAEALGCTFDPLTTAWLRPECPRDGTEEYLNALQRFNLSYWHEENGNPSDRKVPDWEHFSHMDGEFYWSTFYEHLFHCVYMVKRIIHVQRRHGRLDSIAQHITHTDHCLEFIMEGLAKPPEELSGFQRTESPITYLKC